MQSIMPGQGPQRQDPNQPPLFPADIPDRFASNRVYPNVPAHTHNGVDSPRIPASSIVPVPRGSGNVRFATSLQRYQLYLSGTPSQVLFYGNATHTTGGKIDIRAMLMGSAFLGPSYFFQPVDTSSTNPGIIGNVVQSGQMFLVASNNDTATFTSCLTLATEGHLATVVYPNSGTIVARLTIPNPWTQADASFGFTTKGWGPGFLFVDAYLASGWEINGNFVVS